MNSGKQVVCPHCDGLNRVPDGKRDQGPRCGHCHRPLFDGHPVELSNANFERFLAKNELPVLVDFWAPWCGPCRQMAPAYGQAAARYGTRLRFAKLDTERHPDVAARHGIRGIPTLILFDGGRERDRISGALPYPQLASWVERHVD
ncbi:thioredoxin [Sulfurifustis variabilis]|uniref:Thioredoxin n=1 Tax=Sulfurifustis variabilis TaxID=1675686 RepID=A0A1B4VD46_9GAMM|nr:thioredoxin TrxC [Sulfurifustis variabilis]BAU50211.1 thioredoxin [Sulfurifustis variabilis]